MPLLMLSSGADFLLAGDVRKIYKTPKNFLTKRRKNSLQNAEKSDISLPRKILGNTRLVSTRNGKKAFKLLLRQCADYVRNFFLLPVRLYPGL